MDPQAAVAVLGTFDSKGQEHLFLKKCIEKRGLPTFTVHAGTKAPSTFPADVDLYVDVIEKSHMQGAGRDEAIAAVIDKARALLRERYDMGAIGGIISAGGGTGTHIGTSIMRVLPLGVPKVMVSTVASRDMSELVGTRDITMMHSVVDLLGVNSISGGVLYRAAGAVCGMALSRWLPKQRKKRIALSMFGFITEGAERVKTSLEDLGYEVIAFHANGTGGMAMEELAAEGLFDGILDFATHELADELKQGYCRGIGPQRLLPVPGRAVPRLVVPGGLDCAVLEFTRDTIPEAYRDRKIFFYDFRSAVRLDENETLAIADQLAEKLNRGPALNKVLIPLEGWSEADRADAPLYDPSMRDLFIERLKEKSVLEMDIEEMDLHINDEAFARTAAQRMDEMVRERAVTR